MVHVCAACTLVTESMSTRETHVLVACTLALKHSHGSVPTPRSRGDVLKLLEAVSNANHRSPSCVAVWTRSCTRVIAKKGKRAYENLPCSFTSQPRATMSCNQFIAEAARTIEMTKKKALAWRQRARAYLNGCEISAPSSCSQ